MACGHLQAHCDASLLAVTFPLNIVSLVVPLLSNLFLLFVSHPHTLDHLWFWCFCKNNFLLNVMKSLSCFSNHSATCPPPLYKQ